MSHTCPGPACDLRVPDDMLACKRHWFQVSKPVRDQVWATWHRRISPGGGDLAEALENHAAAMDLAIAEMKP